MIVESKELKQAVLHTFGGLLSCSPRLYKDLVHGIATDFSVDPTELRVYIKKVLSELPPFDD